MGESVCCGMKLRTASYFVATVELVGYFVALLSGIWASWALVDRESDFVHPHDKIVPGDPLNVNLLPGSHVDEKTFSTWLFALVLSSFFFGAGVIISLFLFLAIKMKSVAMLKLWLISKAILIAVTLGHLIVSAKPMASIQEGIAAFSTDVSLLCCSFFFIAIILAYRRELDGIHVKEDHQTHLVRASGA